MPTVCGRILVCSWDSSLNSSRLSKRFHSIASDSQLWKALYYERFVRPRASKLPGIKQSEASKGHLNFSSKLSKWLGEENLVRRGKETNWRRQYKLRHNWSQGSCAVNEIEVSDQPSVPPLLVRFHGGIVFTADLEGGLRAWSTEGHGKLLGHIRFECSSAPTSLAVNTASEEARTKPQRLAVGFRDGGFRVFSYDPSLDEPFAEVYSHPASSNGMVTAIAYSSSYLLTMAASRVLSLYRFSTRPDFNFATRRLTDPRLLSSLRSNTNWPSVSLSIRDVQQGIVASIAFAAPAYPAGWSVGVQEMRIAENGDLIESRLASSENAGERFSIPASNTWREQSTSPDSEESVPPPDLHRQGRPTSISYTHPYLLVAHADNTLTLYLVTSTASTLKIGSGSTLWGHTSSVSGAHVGGRGKAVSVSSRGDELRIWELEGGLSSSAARRRLAHGDMSIRVRPAVPVRGPNGDLSIVSDAISRRGTGLGLALGRDHRIDELPIVRGNWVGFDEENVVVLRENGRGNQALVVYDFT
jgi:WD40 repeat protein